MELSGMKEEDILASLSWREILRAYRSAGVVWLLFDDNHGRRTPWMSVIVALAVLTATAAALLLTR